MEMLCYWHFFCCISCKWGTSYLHNQWCCGLAKSAWHHTGRESCLLLENQAATTMLPPQHPVELLKSLWHWVFIITSPASSCSQHCWLHHQSWEREEEASYWSCPCIESQQQLEDLINSLVGWWFKLICFKIYSAHWSSKDTTVLWLSQHSWNLERTIRLASGKVDCIWAASDSFWVLFRYVNW